MMSEATEMEDMTVKFKRMSSVEQMASSIFNYLEDHENIVGMTCHDSDDSDEKLDDDDESDTSKCEL